MELRAWLGLFLLVVYLGLGYLRGRAERRSDATRSFGHPALDTILLLASGLLLASALALALLLFKKNNSHPIAERCLLYLVVLSLGGVLTWLCNGILRRSRRRR